tara:strand:+ start:236 stop:937 length:702 start_codon:yes stop_codon:yes gene_type:complete
MDQLKLSLKFVKLNFKNLISFSVPWFIFCIYFIFFVISELSAVIENIDEPENLVSFIKNNSFNFRVIGFFEDILFIFFIASICLQFNNIYEGKNSESFVKIFKLIYIKIPYLFVATFLSGIAISFGFLVLILPGIYLFGRLCLSPIYIIIENKGPIESIKESWVATDEFGDRLFMYTFLFGILLILITILTSSLLSLSSLTSVLIIPVMLLEIIILSMVLCHIYFSLYKYLKQ